MAPQATLIDPVPTVESPLFSSFPHASNRPRPFVPVALLIFLGLCFAYTLSYILYRFVMSRRRGSEEATSISPDRGVSQLMNGVRLTLNFGHSRKPTGLLPNESLNTIQEETPLADPSLTSLKEVPETNPEGLTSLPLIVVMPPLTLHRNQEISEVQLPARGPTATGEQASVLIPVQAPAPPTQPPFSQRVAAKVRFLSRDRVEAIAQDPKLAPVQGPLRPLSMVTSPTREKRTSRFGLGLIPSRDHDGDPEADSGS